MLIPTVVALYLLLSGVPMQSSKILVCLRMEAAAVVLQAWAVHGLWRETCAERVRTDVPVEIGKKG